MSVYTSSSTETHRKRPPCEPVFPDAPRYPPVPCEQCGGPLDVLGLVAGDTPATQYENVRCYDCGAGGTLVRRVADWGISNRVGPAVSLAPPAAGPHPTGVPGWASAHEPDP